MLWDNAIVCCKVYSYQFNKALIGQYQAGNIGRVTRLREFWEEERKRVCHKPDAEEVRCECLTEKGTKSYG